MAASKSNRSIKTVLILILLIIGWISALFIESSQPPLPLLGEVAGLDKVAHFLAFSGLGLLVCGLFFTLRPRTVIPFFSAPLLVVTLLGVIEECYQMMIPTRAASLWDLVADVCGALFAIFLANRIARLNRLNNPISSG